MTDREDGMNHVLTRRRFLGAGVAAGTALILPRGRMFASALEEDVFAAPLKVPPVLRPVRSKNGVDFYELTMRASKAQILPGKRTPVWGYNGMFPGPTIKVRANRKAVVRQINRLRIPTTVHLHGAHVAPSSDGYPLDLIRPGEHKDYVYPNKQLGATLWYHDHTHHHTSRNVYMGLAGFYLIYDEAEDDLNLPKGRYDIPLALQDRSFKADGSFDFKDRIDAVRGDTFLVNGKPTPHHKVANRKYRFRILNASNTREYKLALDSGMPLTQIASDGGLLSAPSVTPSIPIWPAERVEIVIDFSAYPVGSSVVLIDADGDIPTQGRPIMRFDIDREEDDPSSLPPTLRPVERMSPGETDRKFQLTFDLDRGLWLINGKSFDSDRFLARPRRGETEIWEFENASRLTHPMHIHLVQFQVLDRNGQPPLPGEAGWKDTVPVHSGDRVRVAMRFKDYTGKYVFHCHNLAHECHSMMAQMKVLP